MRAAFFVLVPLFLASLASCQGGNLTADSGQNGTVAREPIQTGVSGIAMGLYTWTAGDKTRHSGEREMASLDGQQVFLQGGVGNYRFQVGLLVRGDRCWNVFKAVVLCAFAAIAFLHVLRWWRKLLTPPCDQEFVRRHRPGTL